MSAAALSSWVFDRGQRVQPGPAASVLRVQLLRSSSGSRVDARGGRSPEIVRAVAAGPEHLDVETLRARFNPEAMARADLYPGIWSDSDMFDTYVVPHFAELSRFAAAIDGEAVLLAHLTSQDEHARPLQRSRLAHLVPPDPRTLMRQRRPRRPCSSWDSVTVRRTDRIRDVRPEVLAGWWAAR